jgi:hypothetical protein
VNEKRRPQAVGGGAADRALRGGSLGGLWGVVRRAALTAQPAQACPTAEFRREITLSVIWSSISPLSGPVEAAMSKDNRPPDTEEIERITRMARESRDFYKGLAKALGPQQDRKAAEAQQPDKGVNDN